MRAHTSDKAELVTQVLFGECYEVIGKEGNWLQLQLATDSYQGWIDFKQHTPVTAAYFEEWRSQPHPRAMDYIAMVNQPAGAVPIGIGSYLPFFDGTAIRVNSEQYAFKGSATAADVRPSQAALLDMAHKFLKSPYLWGGKSTFGIDCSGLMQQVYGLCGYQLPRDASQQVAHGEEVHFVAQAQPGDLAFFSNAEGRIVHVGIMLGGQKILHAHGEVRIDTLDHNGIYNADQKRYTHQLRIIKRVLA